MADKHRAVAVDERHADAGAIGQIDTHDIRLNG
jgi:hypothetical protein